METFARNMLRKAFQKSLLKSKYIQHVCLTEGSEGRDTKYQNLLKYFISVHLNINTIRNRFNLLKNLTKGNASSFLMTTET